MAKKTSRKKKITPAKKTAAKKVALRAGKRHAGNRLHARSAVGSSASRAPKEWQRGRIVLGKPPAKSIKGRGAERVPANTIRDTQSRPIPRKVCDWFVRKLDASHKVLVRPEDYDAPKVPHLSPESARLLREQAAAWARLAEAERDAVRKREQASLGSLPKIATPKEFQDGKVVLSKPKQPVDKAHCWKPDFEGEIYPAVLHYYGYLPVEHIGSITDANGYPAKAMSPEAAVLYREHRSFWEAKHVESKAKAKAASAARKQTGDSGFKQAAASAGLSRADLEAKLDRLASFIENSNLQLAAEMIAGFGDAWLYGALLAGASVTRDGKLTPGKVLKRFKKRADLVLVLALASMAQGMSVDPTLHRNAHMIIDVAADTIDIIAEVALRLPNLQGRWRYSDLEDLTELLPQTVAFLANHREDVKLSVKRLGAAEATVLAKHVGDLYLLELQTVDTAVAAALGQHSGSLLLGLTELPEAIAGHLARHQGDLDFPNLRTISASAAVALEKHVGYLTLGSEDHIFDLDAMAARHLSLHPGPVALPGVRRLDPQTALALAAQPHWVELKSIQEFPAGSEGVSLCKRIAASSKGYLSLWDLDALSAECASALGEFSGKLLVRMKMWSEEALIALAKQRGELDIDPTILSAVAASALSRRAASTALIFSELRTLCVSDEAADALRAYKGKLSFEGNVEMSPAAAKFLTERKSLVVFRSRIKPSIRKIFGSAGSWKESVWTRHASSAKAAAGKSVRSS